MLRPRPGWPRNCRRGAHRCLALVGTAMFVLACSPAAEEAPRAALVRFEGPTMGTRYAVQVVGQTADEIADEAWQERLRQRIEDELTAVNDKMSTYVETSELSLFNASSETGPQPMSRETLAVLALAEEVSLASRGAFDVTVGPLVDAWGFGPSGPAPGGLSAERIEALHSRVGYTHLDVRAAEGTLAKAVPDLAIDLSAIAKGYAVDQVAHALDESGISNYLVEVGGEVRARGVNPSGEPWRIGIEKPTSGLQARRVKRTVRLRGLAMATSGDYRNFYELDGRRYSHLIDARDGLPVRHNAASVSVIDKECARADAWATALWVLGPQEGLAVAEEHDVAAWFLTYEDDGLGEVGTSAFIDLTEPEGS